MEIIQPASYFKKFEDSLLTEDVRKIAEAELHEKEDEIQRNLQTLKELLTNEKDLSPCLDDRFLLMFLRARKFNIPAAYSLIKKYFMIRVKYPKMFQNFHPKSCMKVIRENIHYFLPYRSPEGCAILYSRFGKWNTHTLLSDELLKFNLVCIDYALQNPLTQICGVIIIVDLSGITWSHLFQLNMSTLRCFVSTLQDCSPLRKKATHIINESSVFSMAFSVVKPMLSEKIKNRIFLHGSNLSSLHHYLPPEILPEELGGKLSNKPNEEFYNSLLNTDEDFKARHSYGYLNKKY